MKYEEYKDICLSLKNDLSFEEFSILGSFLNYTDDYIEKTWEYYCSKPLEFVLYHNLGKEIFNYLKSQKELIGR
jgi:hypothetical protein